MDSKALENYEFYYDRADADDYDIDLDTLRFETYDNIDSDTLDFDVRLYGDEGSFYATVRIDVEGGSRSGSGDVELTYKVDPGDDVTVDAEDFWDLFDEEDGRYDELEYVEFTSYDDSMTSDISVQTDTTAMTISRTMSSMTAIWTMPCSITTRTTSGTTMT